MGLGLERRAPATMQEKQGGLAGRHVQSMLPFLEPREKGDTQRGGGDERGLGSRAGEGAGLPLTTPPPLPRSASSPSRAHRTSGNFPLPSFHLSVHRPRGAAVLSSDPALCVQALGCSGQGADPERPAVFRDVSAQDMGTTQPRAPVKSCHLQEILPPPAQNRPRLQTHDHLQA